MGSFVPRSTRNRWAWGLAWLNLLLLLVWNFLPKYVPAPVKGETIWVKDGLILEDFWQLLFHGLVSCFGRSLDFEVMISICLTCALICMVLLQLCFAPLWQIFCHSKLLRFIPMGIFSIGILSILYIFNQIMPLMSLTAPSTIPQLSLISLNFLLSIIILLLYRPESNEVQPITES